MRSIFFYISAISNLKYLDSQVITNKLKGVNAKIETSILQKKRLESLKAALEGANANAGILIQALAQLNEATSKGANANAGTLIQALAKLNEAIQAFAKLDETHAELHEALYT